MEKRESAGFTENKQVADYGCSCCTLGEVIAKRWGRKDGHT